MRGAMLLRQDDVLTHSSVGETGGKGFSGVCGRGRERGVIVGIVEKLSRGVRAREPSWEGRIPGAGLMRNLMHYTLDF